MKPYTRRKLLATTVAGGSVLTAGCLDTGGYSEHVEDISVICDSPLPETSDGGGTWPTNYHDAQNTGHGPNVSGPTGRPNTEWRVNLSKYSEVDHDTMPFARMTFDASAFYVSGNQADMFAVSPETGEMEWAYQGEYVKPHTPIHVDDRIYRTNGTYIQEFEDRERRRMIDLGGGDRKRMQVSNGSAYVVDLAGRISAVDLETETIAWSAQSTGVDPETMDERPGSTFGERYANGAFEEPPALTEDRVFAASWDTTLYAFDRQDGRLLWTREFEFEFDTCAPVVRHGSVFITDGSILRCLDPESGRTKWERTTGVFGPQPVVTDSELIITHGKDRLFLKAMDYETGEDLWKREIPKEPSDLIVAGGVIYTIAGSDIAFDRSDGTRLLRVDGYLRGPLCVGGGSLVFLHPDRVRGIR